MKDGIEIRALEYDELDRFKKITEATGERRNFSDRTLAYYQKMYQLFHPNDEVHFLLATLNLEKLTLQLEEQKGYLVDQKLELQEALDAGNAALSCTDQILSELDSAEGWGTWDLVGGGLITDLVKHSHLDAAQASVETLQTQLRRFKTELADVTIDADIQVNIDGFLRVADYFFDGIFADWTVLDQIHQSQEQVDQTRSQIYGVLDHLRTLMEQTEAQISCTSQEVEQLVASASM